MNNVRSALAKLLPAKQHAGWVKFSAAMEVYDRKTDTYRSDTTISIWSEGKRYSRTGTTISAVDKQFAVLVIESEKKVIVRDVAASSVDVNPMQSFQILYDSLQNVTCNQQGNGLLVTAKGAWLEKAGSDSVNIQLRKHGSGYVVDQVSTEYRKNVPVKKVVMKNPKVMYEAAAAFTNILDLVYDARGEVLTKYRKFEILDYRQNQPPKKKDEEPLAKAMKKSG